MSKPEFGRIKHPVFARHESTKSRSRRRNSILRWTFVFWLAVLVVWLCVASAPNAHAADAGIDLPGIEVCPKEAPFAATPETGLAGLLGERPIRITTDNSPEHIWSTGGFAGLRSHTYDLGCAIDPTSWMRITNASADSKIVNGITAFGDGLVSLTDSVDRRAWQAGWITSFLEDFARRATGIINTTIVIPFVGLGLIIACIILLYRAHDGDIHSAATNVGWVFVVATVTGFLLLSPLFASKVGQVAGGTLVAALNNGANPSDAATNQVVKNVQYQGWLRRNFGSINSPAGVKYGPDLLASTRVSWAELDAITALAPKDQAKARKELTEKKARQFKDIAAKVKDDDPTAYRYLTGEELSSTETLVEVAFDFAACFFRLAVAILMITCRITLVLLAIFWLVLTPLIILPRVGRHSGQEMGVGLFNNAVQATGYVLAAAVGSWLFGIYLQACMAPGMSLWWSLLLLVLGSGIAWTVIRPDRKFLSIVSLGRINGYGYIGRLLKGLALSYIGGRVAGAAVANAVDDREQETPERMSENVPPEPEVIYANIFNPEDPFIVDAEALPSGMPAYERPTGQPDPPPDRAESPYENWWERGWEPYEPSDDTEGART